MTKLSPIVSEFATEEEADAYDAWLRKKVQLSLAEGKPNIPHDEVMAELREIIDRKAKKRDAS